MSPGGPVVKTTSSAEPVGSSGEEELRSHMPHCQNTETKKPYCNRFNKDLKKKKKKYRGGEKTFLPGEEKFGNG